MTGRGGSICDEVGRAELTLGQQESAKLRALSLFKFRAKDIVFRVQVGAELTLWQQKAAQQHVQQEYEPGKGVGHHNGSSQGSYEAEQGQGVLMRQHEQEQEAEEPAGKAEKYADEAEEPAHAAEESADGSMCCHIIGAYVPGGAWIYNHKQHTHNTRCIHVSAMVLGCTRVNLQTTWTQHIVHTGISCGA